jgi:hypothetical protein
MSLLAACQSGVVGVEACRDIEGARCDASGATAEGVEGTACGFTAADVKACRALYQDQCLRGIENVEHTPTDDETDECVAAVDALAACALAGIDQAGACDGVQVELAGATLSPCEIIQGAISYVTACKWVAAATSGLEQAK